MTPWCRQYINEDEVLLFEKIRKAVMDLPDIDLGNNEGGKPIVLSCHMLARAVAKVFGLKYQDGYFHPNFNHTWVVFPVIAGNRQASIIDVYPVGIFGGPWLMSGGYACIIPTYYRPQSAKWMSSGRFSKNSFRRSVRRIESALRKTSKSGSYQVQHQLSLKLY